MNQYPPMQKAKTLRDIYNNFEGNRALGEEEYEDFFVNLYDKKLKRFLFSIESNMVYEKMFFIAGQQGNGKSTILNVLKQENKNFADKYEIRHLQTKDIFQYQDISIIDILFAIALDFLDNTQDDNKEKLSNKFKEQLNELADLSSGEIEKIESSFSEEKIHISLKSSISLIMNAILAKGSLSANANYNANAGIRQVVKKIYKFNIELLLNLVNAIISSYKQAINSDKEILLIIDGLEKTTEVANITKVFVNDIGVLKNLKCFKIVTIPIYLKERAKNSNVEIIDFTMEADDECKIKQTDLLKEVISKRIENEALLTDKAIDLAVQKSGGNIRLLLNIIQDAARESITISETDAIDVQEIKSAVSLIGGTMSTTAQMNREFLKKIREHKQADKEEGEILNEMINRGLVFAYCNGKTQYNINPTIEASLE